MPPKRVDPMNMGGAQESDSDAGDMGGHMGAPGFDPARFTNPNYSREFLATLPAQIRKRVSALIGLDKKFMEAKKEYEAKRNELLIQFESKAAPLHQERKAIVSGAAAVTEEQVNEGFPDEHRTAEVDISASAEEAATQQLTGFWLKALQRHVIVNDMISEKDAEIMKFVTDITCTSLAAPASGFIVRFEFAKNDFFTNTELTKTFHLKEIFDELTVDRVEGTKIDWTAPEKNVTVEVIKKKQKAKIKGKVVHRTIEKTQPCDSFFRFFNEGPISGEGGAEEEADEDNEFEELDEDQWLGLAHVLRDKIIPYAVEYYTGEAPDGSSDLEDDDEFEGEEGEEEEEEDDEPVQMPAQRRGAGGGAGPAASSAPRGKGGRGGAAPAGANPQDCKQQ